MATVGNRACHEFAFRAPARNERCAGEWFGHDAAGNLIRHTNHNGVVITNSYDAMDRLTNRSSAGGYSVSWAYSVTGRRTNLVDSSGMTTYQYDNRDRLRLKTVKWASGPEVALNYAHDRNGNVTNIWSSTPNGVNLRYEHDGLNRVTNVLANGAALANYGWDGVGNLESVRYAAGVTNLAQYDPLNQLTNSVWKSNSLVLASFEYRLGKTGSRTNLSETLLNPVTNRTHAWEYDPLYRLRKETISGFGDASYGFDRASNRTNRTAGLGGLPEQNFAYNTNDQLTTDAHDFNGKLIRICFLRAHMYSTLRG